jgi:phosphatidylserine synthase
MTTLVTQAAWVLSAAFVLSGVYELYRVTARAGTSRHDSIDAFLRNNIVLYAVAVVVIGLLLVGFAWAPIIALVFSVAVIGASIAFYNPRIMLERQPGLIDWFEDLVFTGLLFVAAALLAYQVLGISLQPSP